MDEGRNEAKCKLFILLSRSAPIIDVVMNLLLFVGIICAVVAVLTTIVTVSGPLFFISLNVCILHLAYLSTVYHIVLVVLPL